ncbi:hypothetical protein LVB87_14340 [Lysobacter sp. KIS68-7]|uniref:hypothetical protein n=1 Tax=Lysobacter sp. KIS68-7 TaxID=2904252 RepID=UPI001E5DF1FE|nr:hypothetical protein [Lysobacter sp. KIS68-7]UHQ19346.1 hypothetical protein LVB87_14340 [Lysobacter sp. KIS68-7]
MRNTFALPMAACLSVLAIAPMATNAASDQAMPPPLEEVMTMRVAGEIAVDPGGHVRGYVLASKVPDSIRARLDKAIPNWTFIAVAPPDGANESRTPMLLSLVATKVADGYAIRLEDVAFGAGGDDMRDRLAPRTFLKSPLRATNAIVRVAVRLDETGHAQEVAPIGCALHNAGGDAEEKALMCQRLEKLSAEAASLSHYARSSMALPGVGQVWFEFTSGGPIDDRLGKWRIESRTGTRDVPWFRPVRTVVYALSDGIVGGAL